MKEILTLAMWLIAFILNIVLIVIDFHYIRVAIMFGIIYCIALILKDIFGR